jgi:low affinity Fe/Cu permease
MASKRDSKKSGKEKQSHSGFGDLARKVSSGAGSPLTFFLAVSVIVVWAITGPMFHYNDTWQLVINTGTTIVTFLMVFLIQNTQNRDSAAVQLKLDEIIRAIDAANDDAMGLEDKSQEELDELKQQYVDLANKTQATIEKKSGTRARGKKAS